MGILDALKQTKVFSDKPVGERVMTDLQQAGAGLMLPFAANKDVRKSKYSGWDPRILADAPPVAIDMIPALGGLADRLTHRNEEAPTTGVRGYMQRAMGRVGETSDRLNADIGINNPDSLEESAANILGSLILPTPKGSKAVATAAAGGSKASRVAKAVAKGAVEAVVPLRQTSLKGAAAVALPIGLGVHTAAQAAGTMHDAPDVLPPAPDEDAPDVLASVDEDAPDVLANPDLPHPEIQRKVDVPLWKNPLVQGGVILSTVGLGLLGMNAAQRALQARLIPNASLIGNPEAEQFTSGAARMSGAFTQADAPIRDASRKINSKPVHEQFMADLDGIIPATVNSKIGHSFRTGELPNSVVKVKPWATIADSFAAEIPDPAQQRMVSEGLLKMDALDEYKHTGKFSAFFKATPAANADPQIMFNEQQAYAQTLAADIATAQSDPIRAKYMAAVQDQYRGMLQYKQDAGLITVQEALDLATKRPNFVHRSRNVKEGSGIDEILGVKSKSESDSNAKMRFYNRADEISGGVKTGEAADPMREVATEWARTIHTAEVNRVRTRFMKDAIADPNLSKFVKEVQGETHKNEKTLVTMEGGKRRFFNVNDPQLRDALAFPTTARSALTNVLSVPKQWIQAQATGVLAPLFAPVSAMYDTATSYINMPKGYEMGVVNEAMNRRGLKMNLGAFDPTAALSPITGSVRLAVDKSIENISASLSKELMSGDGILTTIFGPQHTQALETFFSKAYHDSTLYTMRKYGALSDTLYSANDPSQLATGMNTVAPTFTAEMSKRAAEEAIAGLPTAKNTIEAVSNAAKAALTASNDSFVRARASGIARLYSSILKTIHEGPRYATFAANESKAAGNADKLAKLSSVVRRASGDTGQVGGAHVVQELNEVVPYMNAAIQPLMSTARAIKEDAHRWLLRTSLLTSGSLALLYGHALSSPEAMERRRKMTDADKAAGFETFGDLWVPFDPNMRPHMAILTGLLDEYTGINTGLVDPSIASVFDRMLEGEEMSDIGEQSLSDRMRLAMQSANPLNPYAAPPVAAAAAGLGIDPGLSRYTGTTMPVKVQTTDPAAGGEGKLADDAISAQHMMIINTLTAGVTQNLIRAAMDADRAFSTGVDTKTGIDVAMSRLQEGVRANSGVFKHVLFKDQPKLESINSPDVALWYKRADGIDTVGNIFDQNLRKQFVSGLDPKYATLRPIDMTRDYQGTAIDTIGQATLMLEKSIYQDKRRLATIQHDINDYNGQYKSTVQQRALNINTLNDDKREIIDRMQAMTRITEAKIATQIGDPSFTYRNFDKEKYARMPGAVQPIAPVAGEPATTLAQ